VEVICTSPWVPVEWIAAHGLEPRGAWFAVDELPAVAVPEGVCAFAQAMLELAKSKPAAAVIFTTACDQMRRAADAAASHGLPRAFLFNLPATWQTPAARRLYHTEVERLGKFLAQHGGRPPTDRELEVAINRHEETRARARTTLERNPAQQGVQELRWLFDCAGCCSEEGQNHASSRPDPPPQGEGRRGFNELAEPTSKSARRRDSSRIPLALLGGPLLPLQWPLFDAIELAGGRVVLNATEPGERSLLPPIPKPDHGETLFAQLVNHYFDHVVDVFQRPDSRLYDWLAPRLAERGVSGLVLWVHVSCDLWRAEAASLREAFGLPVLLLESHELRSGNRRDASRLESFIESLANLPPVEPTPVAEARRIRGPQCKTRITRPPS